MVTEFFVSRDLSVDEALPYIPAEEESIRQSLDTIKKSGNVRPFLQKAITFVLAEDALRQQHTKLSKMVRCHRITITTCDTEC